jgi:hypothetical protein
VMCVNRARCYVNVVCVSESNASVKVEILHVNLNSLFFQPDWMTVWCWCAAESTGVLVLSSILVTALY